MGAFVYHIRELYLLSLDFNKEDIQRQPEGSTVIIEFPYEFSEFEDKWNCGHLWLVHYLSFDTDQIIIAYTMIQAHLERQKMFCKEYIIDLKRKMLYTSRIRAKLQKQIGSENLSKPYLARRDSKADEKS